MKIAELMREGFDYAGGGADVDPRPAPAKSSFWQSGHTPTLIAAFLYFDLAFMVWVLLGPLAPDIAKTLQLTAAQKGLMVATPTLAGALLRVVNGLLVDRIGPKRAGAISQIIVIVGLFTAWVLGVNSFAGTLALGVILGFAGASFAIALPLASRWYPPEHQGKAMGLAGMGNSGTVLAVRWMLQRRPWLVRATARACAPCSRTVCPVRTSRRSGSPASPTRPRCTATQSRAAMRW